MLEKDVAEKYYISQRTLEKIANWNSHQNPLERVCGEAGKCQTITTRVADSSVNASTILISQDFSDTKNLRPYYQTRTNVTKDNLLVENYRIRKLTPKECFRLMGVKDEDYKRVAKNQSNSSLYHLAGDSIVVSVLAAIFNEMLEGKR
jgi:DNA (cytosine-5)-methyltransferase 1